MKGLLFNLHFLGYERVQCSSCLMIFPMIFATEVIRPLLKQQTEFPAQILGLRLLRTPCADSWAQSWGLRLGAQSWVSAAPVGGSEASPL